MAQIIKKHAEKRGMPAAAFAFQWVLNNNIVTSALAGPRTLTQWQSYIAATKHRLNAEDEALINDMVVSGHPSTPGYNDPQYAILGRPTENE